MHQQFAVLGILNGQTRLSIIMDRAACHPHATGPAATERPSEILCNHQWPRLLGDTPLAVAEVTFRIALIKPTHQPTVRNFRAARPSGARRCSRIEPRL